MATLYHSFQMRIISSRSPSRSLRRPRCNKIFPKQLLSDGCCTTAMMTKILATHMQARSRDQILNSLRDRSASMEADAIERTPSTSETSRTQEIRIGNRAHRIRSSSRVPPHLHRRAHSLLRPHMHPPASLFNLHRVRLQRKSHNCRFGSFTTPR